MTVSAPRLDAARTSRAVRALLAGVVYHRACGGGRIELDDLSLDAPHLRCGHCGATVAWLHPPTLLQARMPRPSPAVQAAMVALAEEHANERRRDQAEEERWLARYHARLDQAVLRVLTTGRGPLLPTDILQTMGWRRLGERQIRASLHRLYLAGLIRTTLAGGANQTPMAWSNTSGSPARCPRTKRTPARPVAITGRTPKTTPAHSATTEAGALIPRVRSRSHEGPRTDRCAANGGS